MEQANLFTFQDFEKANSNVSLTRDEHHRVSQPSPTDLLVARRPGVSGCPARHHRSWSGCRRRLGVYALSTGF